MQVKKSSSGVIQYRANRQLVQANRKAVQDGQVSSNKELVEAASKIQVTRRDPVKPGQVLFQERIPISPTPEEQAAKVFTKSYLEQQQQNGGDSVSCFRSTGAVPIPTRRCSAIINGTLPKVSKPRKLSMPEPLLRNAEQIMLEPLEEVGSLEDLEPAMRLNYSVIADLSIRAIAHDPPSVSHAPPKKAAKPDCKKHSKCHCALFSQQVQGFFDVAKY